jgi:uncharacterized protein (UPF0332 family)
MMDAVDFYHFAESLYNPQITDGAEARSCISRAYYAAFLVAREITGTKKGGNRSHQNVIDDLKKQNPFAGDNLSALHVKRKKADYDVELDIVHDEVVIALGLAKEILTDLGKNIAS